MMGYRKPWLTSRSIGPVVARVKRVANQARQRADGRISWGALAFILAHVPFAFAMQSVPVIAKLHSIVVVAAGLWYASGRGSPVDVARLIAYLVGAEVLWRMCGGGLFWEFGKYGFALVLGVHLCRKGYQAFDWAAMGYFLLLLPAAALTIIGSSAAVAKNDLSYYLSGPLAFAIGVSFFARLRLNSRQLRSLLFAAMAPILGVAALCFRATFGSDEIEFGTGSNIAGSGGFGPNQVSAALGFGIVIATSCLWLTTVSKLVRWLLLGTILLFITQGLLTLSRTGLWLAGVSCLLAGVQLARSPQQRLHLMLGAVTVGLLCGLIVLPMVDELSNGAVSSRFKETSGTGREQIALADLQVWASRPLTGAGVGMATAARMEFGVPRKGSHTEYTRLLSEHGLLGMASLGLLCYVVLRAYRSAQSLENKVLMVATTAFGLLFMSVSAMRMVLPAFMISMGCAKLVAAKTRPLRPLPPGTGPRMRLNQSLAPGVARPNGSRFARR